jgi:hypothetical protein
LLSPAFLHLIQSTGGAQDSGAAPVRRQTFRLAAALLIAVNAHFVAFFTDSISPRPATEIDTIWRPRRPSRIRLQQEVHHESQTSDAQTG